MTGDVGVLTVSDAKTGARVYQERVGGVYTASPVAGDGKVYLASEDGETIVLSAGSSPTVIARNKLTARQLASPAVAGGRLFIRSDDVLYAIGEGLEAGQAAAEPERLPRYRHGPEVRARPRDDAGGIGGLQGIARTDRQRDGDAAACVVQAARRRPALDAGTAAVIPGPVAGNPQTR